MSESRRRARGRIPWTRGLFGLAVVGPALALGGVHPVVVAAWTVVVGVLLARIAWRARGNLVRPWPAILLVVLAGWTLLTALPLPGFRALAAPELQAWVHDALLPAGPDAPSGLSVRPADTLLEVVRLLGLAGLVVGAAQLSWRLSAAAVAGCGLLVAGVGFVHTFAGATEIYGLYTPQHAMPGTRTALLGTFVNPNHQSGLLLLALFAAAALAMDQLHGARTARDAAKAEQRRDRGWAMLGAVALLLPALLLSLSRGAMVALLLLGPVALVVAIRKLPSDHGSQARRMRRGPLFLALGSLAGLVVAIGRHGAWTELATLFNDPSGAYDEKLAPAVEAIALLWHSPVFGTGRGTFIDLFALHAPGSDRLFTHLESAPIVALVEWGLLVGGGVLLAGLVWWVQALRRGGPSRERKARTLLLLGVAALGLQTIGDFSLDFLGVAAPLAALVGGLTPHGRGRISRRRMLRAAPVSAVVGALVVWFVAPHTWTRNAATNAQVRTGQRDLSDALRWRPLDGSLHAVAARSAFERDDLDAARAHATFSTRTRAGSVDAWMMLSAVHDRLAQADARDEALSQALDRVRPPVPPALVDYLLRHYPKPEALEAVTPSRGRAFTAITRALRDAGALDHADAMARARARTHPDDPEPLLVRSQLAADRANPVLALHFARLAQATAPELGATHQTVVATLAQLEGAEAALAELDRVPFDTLPKPDRQRLAEVRVRLLLQRGDPASARQARALAEDLLLHSDDEPTRQRRRALAREAAEASP